MFEIAAPSTPASVTKPELIAAIRGADLSRFLIESQNFSKTLPRNRAPDRAARVCVAASRDA
jgi:hypothetical protein